MSLREFPMEMSREEEIAAVKLVVDLPVETAQDKNCAQASTSDHPPGAQDMTYAQAATSDHPPGPSSAPQATPSNANDAQPFHVHDRQKIWTNSDDTAQIRLNNIASTTLHFPRYLDIQPIDIINALDDLEFEFPQVKAIRRPAPGNFCLTFDSSQTKRRFLQHIGFTVKGFAPLIQEARVRPTFVSIRNASPELPDAAVIARLRCYGTVLSLRRCRHRDSNIENGFRTVRMRIKTPIPSFIRLASESLHVVYDGQPRTCRRCNRVGHDGKDCNIYTCHNCDEIGHVASACVHPTLCSICKSIAHKAYDCPFAIIDDLSPNNPIADSLAAALASVPVIPSVTPTLDSEFQDGEESLTEAADMEHEPITTEVHRSSSSANTAILSVASHSVAEPPEINPPDEPAVSLPAASSPAVPSPSVRSNQAPKTGQGAKPKKPKKPTQKPTDTPPVNSSEEFPDNASVTSTKRKAPSEVSEEINPFIRKQTRPECPFNSKRKIRR